MLYPQLAYSAYPIHCSVGGSAGGLATKGDSRRCFNSSGVYLTAIIDAVVGDAFCEGATSRIGY